MLLIPAAFTRVFGPRRELTPQTARATHTRRPGAADAGSPLVRAPRQGSGGAAALARTSDVDKIKQAAVIPLSTVPRLVSVLVLRSDGPQPPLSNPKASNLSFWLPFLLGGQLPATTGGG